ncbi:type I-E CRISPR-associated protein Cse2/CasB [Lentzea sp. DG1S-22]|uniref:type I-E CRISPR-associated protein Cse2/CasB n=1 Tax=Lentzea sp. DG1S-22 TaxID=3108822 RepID=UPI002E783D9C|nr:type I-E CRISPR-associated protein Cse2/CasB [Lentzea sp. DG1S-22]WVH82762.1 type I-E CRISPR-associated protein Cse2/CasB [Lentzea sp. DG1S-22]
MTTPIVARRRAFTTYLYSLHSGLSSSTSHRVSESRQVLARLRRSFGGPRQQAEAYELVFARNPPESEQEVWLLVAGLFALHPQPRRNTRSLGASMRKLSTMRGASVDRRFTQLLARDREALAHQLRQTIRLLDSEDVPVDYDQLLDDLAVLLGDRFRDDSAQRIRLRWARDYHYRPEPRESTEDTPAPADAH